MGGPKYSICTTHRNNVGLVRQALLSIINQIDSSYEVVVVDSESDDGSLEILKEFERRGEIKLIVQKCSRGKGRQIAFENSRGEFVMAGPDLDDVASPVIADLFKLVETRYPDLVLLPGSVAARDTVKELGGWNDVNWYEDRDFWRRAAMAGKLAKVSGAGSVLKQVKNAHPERKGLMRRARSLYTMELSARQINMARERTRKNLVAQFPVLAVAWMVSLTKPRYGKGLDPHFRLGPNTRLVTIPESLERTN